MFWWVFLFVFYVVEERIDIHFNNNGLLIVLKFWAWKRYWKGKEMKSADHKTDYSNGSREITLHEPEDFSDLAVF
jgi:hypothetical protein